MVKVEAGPAKSEAVKSKMYLVLLIGVLFLVIGGALSIPFVYESQTLWYKVGGDKIMLRAGQMAGLLTAVLLFVQILLAARGKFFQQLFGVAALIRWHRGNGFVVVLLAISHMFLVLIPEGLTNLPIGKKYWPEMVGILLLCIIVAMVITAQWRLQLRLNYERWRGLHKISGYLVIALVAVHALFVSDSFAHAVPRTALLVYLVGVLLTVVVSKKSPRLPAL